MQLGSLKLSFYHVYDHGSTTDAVMKIVRAAFTRGVVTEVLNSTQIAAFNSNAKKNTGFSHTLLSGTSITMVIQLNLFIYIADFFLHFFAPNLRQHQPPSRSIRAADINGVARSDRGRTPPVIFGGVQIFQGSRWLLSVILQVAAASLLSGLKEV